MTEQRTAQPNAGIVEVEGAQLRYLIEGNGRPCIVVGSSTSTHGCSHRDSVTTCDGSSSTYDTSLPQIRRSRPSLSAVYDAGALTTR